VSARRPTAPSRAAGTRRPENSRPAGGRTAPKGRGSRIQIATRNNGTVSVSWRAIVLTLVLAVAFVLVTPTLRYYLRQQEQERRLNEQVAALEARNDSLQNAIDRWGDPNYVRAQARERLGYVMPGQQPYVVIDPEVVVGEDAQRAYEEEMGYIAPTKAWYAEMWDSIRIAGGTEAAAPEGEAADGAEVADPLAESAGDPAAAGEPGADG